MKPIMMTVDLTTGTSQITPVDELFDTYLGGTGAATKLLTDEIALNKDPYAPPSPVFFAIGPFNGLYPLCTKTVALFISPLTGNLGESHAGGNLAMALFQAGIHILKITGRSAFPCYVRIVNHEVSIHRAYSLKGMSALASERVLRERIGNTWKSSIMRVGPAGERESPIACVTVDTSRHFGRLGLGGVFGNKNLKAVIVSGNGGIELGSNKGRYLKFYKNLYDQFVHSPALSKYHDLGTSMNILPLSRINGLPTRNFSQGFFEGAASISGERFADQLLIQKIACAHCPVGCIHMAILRESFDEKNHQYKANKIAYDYELIYALGSNLSINSPEDVLRLLLLIEKQGWDAISMGVTLAWSTEAFMKGVITTRETGGLVFKFGDADTYERILRRVIEGDMEFYRDVEKGTAFLAEKYGGESFAITFGRNEAPGYMTGLHGFLGFSTGVRHSHLDSAGYSLDQKKSEIEKPAREWTEDLFREGRWRTVLNSLVICLFARNVFTMPTILEGLAALGMTTWDEEKLQELARKIHVMKYELKNTLGFSFDRERLPEKLTSVFTATGLLDEAEYRQQMRIFEDLLAKDARALT
ncbi:MAG TPA: aldehyde ferredoxin oxidoreductase N-terminal domain-containing protein [Thermotogota bacterium]|nr:MAG: putative oxidoreductase YdhV [Thermotogota bacterium ADurb.Bin062]HNW46885.1 aldehyde ferredoxin oxidoreductase N-terminal domain-containing protein [Thermotogota bacterium]HOD90119.1 aldehyde ferredoxin oxidoreductase N-terminal domain-containing protein [Thermotogota bacterium]HOF22676.1 aldehyde ferredoxin oxidoreductase N-terminal domain-containing protein [Thermotogota bacterium]HOH11640.1 aldehyde ferredoxin oxidoreductase N-terminal domain-containing protein [Thermotogota bacteri